MNLKEFMSNIERTESKFIKKGVNPENVGIRCSENTIYFFPLDDDVKGYMFKWNGEIMTEKQSENNNKINEFIDDSEMVEKRIKINKSRTKNLIEILQYSNEIEFTCGMYALKFIVESIDELEFNDSVVMKISKDINEDYFKINVKLKLE